MNSATERGARPLGVVAFKMWDCCAALGRKVVSLPERWRWGERHHKICLELDFNSKIVLFQHYLQILLANIIFFNASEASGWRVDRFATLDGEIIICHKRRKYYPSILKVFCAFDIVFGSTMRMAKLYPAKIQTFRASM